MEFRVTIEPTKIMDLTISDSDVTAEFKKWIDENVDPTYKDNFLTEDIYFLDEDVHAIENKPANVEYILEELRKRGAKMDSAYFRLLTI